MMNFKELVSIVSNETGVPAADVRKVGNSMIAKFADLIDEQGKFVSPLITIQGITLSAKEASEDKPARPERKIARMRLRAKKS
jgi:hypothetical protein